MRRLTSLLFCASLGGHYGQRIGCAPSQAAETRLDNIHGTTVPNAPSAKLQLNDARVSGLQSTGPKTNDGVLSSGSSRPIWIWDDVHGASKGGTIRPGTEVCDGPLPCTKCLAVQTCTRRLLSPTAPLCPSAQGASGATTCAKKCWTSWPSTYLVASCICPQTYIRPLSPPPARPRPAPRSVALLGRLPALPRPQRPRGHGETARSLLRLDPTRAHRRTRASPSGHRPMARRDHLLQRGRRPYPWTVSGCLGAEGTRGCVDAGPGAALLHFDRERSDGAAGRHIARQPRHLHPRRVLNGLRT